jgi:eukaryotic-like serine/threonine-protein kinase
VTPDRFAHFRILRSLGQGGMGVVYEAFDERLQRRIAIKSIRADRLDDVARRRFWREARSAASVSHPNVCQVFDIGEVDGTLYLAMELLEGQTLAQRVAQGPIPVRDTIHIALDVLAALEALHAKDLVHRDVKPANVFLTTHGVKLLDFGLATGGWADALGTTGGAESMLTLPGTLTGTPSYMAPEQALGEAATPASDVFAVGAVLFEMLTGRRAFERKSIAEVLYAVQTANPPALTGSPALVAVDRVLHVALAKRPAERYPSAAAMATGLRAALGLASASSGDRDLPGVREVRRLVVLPFRLLRADPDADFLAMSLPDAITHSLSELDALVVRSSLVGARYAVDTIDVQKVAAEADVDLVLTGTLLRAGDRLQVSAQLFETPSGTLVKSHVARVAWGDIFDLQAELVRQVIDVLALPLTTRERRNLLRDAPADPEAYQLYLRANEASSRTEGLAEAIELYEACLRLDPQFAPAMARLGRCYRYQGKYQEGAEADLSRAQSLLRQALDINPDLGVAHGFFAQLEADRGRAEEALLRLVGRLEGAPHSPDLYAGLVHTCRFCGLLDASVAAHRQAQRFNSRVPTSVTQTYFVLGQYERCLQTYREDLGYIGALALHSLGRSGEALALITEREQWRQTQLGIRLLHGLRALIEGRRDDCVRIADETVARHSLGGEELFYLSRHYAWAGDVRRAVETLARTVEGGYFNYPTLVRDAWFDQLRGEPAFEAVLSRAASRHQAAQAAFQASAGARLLEQPG